MRKPRRKLWKLFHSKKYWFVVSVREDGDSRCWGFYKSKKLATKAVEGNWSDLNENGHYPYVVIEPHYEGLVELAFSTPSIWFRETYHKIDIEKLRAELPKDLQDTISVNKATGRIVWKQRAGEDGPTYWTSNFDKFIKCEDPEFARYTWWAM